MNAIIESGFLDTLTDLVNRFATWIAGFVSAHPQLAKFIAIIGVAAAVLGPLLLALGVIIPILIGSGRNRGCGRRCCCRDRFFYREQ